MGILRVALLLLATLAASRADESCHSFAGGSVYPAGTGRNLEHSLQFTKAVSLYSAHPLVTLDLNLILFTAVSKPAPNWEGTAVVGGEIKEIRLSDYRGKYLVFFFYPLDL
jgi:peroxiredoxin 2/4